MDMVRLLFTLVLSIIWAPLQASTDGWQPSPGHTQRPIWPQGAPGKVTVDGPESVTRIDGKGKEAGASWNAVKNVAQPTLTLYPPRGKNTGVAVLVFPGGGYTKLAIDLEGTEACEWLVAHGITAVLLKYRVPFSGDSWDEKNHRRVQSQAALQDAQRALGLVRHHAKEWQIDPRKIGVLGFSAGGHMVALMSTQFRERVYAPLDDADQESCRPDFAVALYPGHLSLRANSSELTPGIADRITRETPPTFLVHAENDPVDRVENSLAYYLALKRVGAPVEMHLFAQGGHAFGLRPSKYPITQWPELFERWLQTIAMIPAQM